MKKVQLEMTTVGLIAITRVILGVGIGVLLAEKLSKEQRHAVGWTLFLVGAGTTVPLAAHVLGNKLEEVSSATRDTTETAG